MKVLFLISHPAHFWMFKNTINNLEQDGHETVVVIRPKDVLVDLCDNANLKYHKLKDRPKKWGIFGLGVSVVEKSFDVDRIIAKTKPDFLIASDGVIAWSGRLRGIPSFEASEDDASVISLYAKIYYPFYTGILSPYCCDNGRWNYKSICYRSYHELGYLHPNHFTPDISVLGKYGIDPQSKYFILRFSALSAHHDNGIHGISIDIAQHLIELLRPYGTIYITSERELEPQLNQYRIKINPLDMHHVIAFAQIYLGDSQTMAAEAGVLGVPFVRYNDFVGRIGYLRELEDKYFLGYGIKASEDGPERMYKVVEELLNTDNCKELFQRRRQKMLDEKIDYSKFLTWFIEKYPESKKIMIDDPEYQYKFK